ncbi:efflux RND transporter periplasmic adaptor subunit [Ruminococcus albus]|uniref:RND family efflux transporter, MFP subunit n=1 Tax=Ruminococcus albus TaxID=1264 RepID=A0A1H7HWN4_RUMAL|nr:efflux RND transporter periplasmic adaptor subunit [Ruminococcus albus]SEK54554.1 RND family efflux transporter, MFP subunit [Ruminococcus albus]
MMNGLVNIKRIFCRTLPALMCTAAVFMTSGCYLLPDEEEAAIPPAVKASEVSYTTVTAKRKDIEKKIVSTGTVTAERQYDLSYEKQSGVILEFNVRAGDKVKKDDPICEIDTSDLDDQIAEKELYLQKAKLNVDMIWENGGTQAQIDSAYVDVQLIERELNKLRTKKEGAVLRSPIDGVVSQLADVREGDTVSSGQTVATVIDTTALYIAVKPEDMTKFDIDTKVQIRINENYYDGVVFMNPSALAEYQEEVKASHDKEDKTGISYESDYIYVRFDGDIPPDALGQLADVILVLDKAENAIVISNNLIKKVDGEKVVYVLKNGEKVAVPVEVGLSTGSQSEIISGIEEGDELVLK